MSNREMPLQLLQSDKIPLLGDGYYHSICPVLGNTLLPPGCVDKAVQEVRVLACHFTISSRTPELPPDFPFLSLLTASSSSSRDGSSAKCDLSTSGLCLFCFTHGAGVPSLMLPVLCGVRSLQAHCMSWMARHTFFPSNLPSCASSVFLLNRVFSLPCVHPTGPSRISNAHLMAQGILHSPGTNLADAILRDQEPLLLPPLELELTE